MPYEIKGNCIYKKDGGAKVGCTKGDVHKYMAALHANANESAIDSDIKTLIRTRLREGLFDNINDEDFKKAYINKINKLYDNLLVNVSLNQNYRFILGNKIVYNCSKENQIIFPLVGFCLKVSVYFLLNIGGCMIPLTINLLKSHHLMVKNQDAMLESSIMKSMMKLPSQITSLIYIFLKVVMCSTNTLNS